jgi:ribosomal protein S18 acetylase RimI-like enzyme
VLSSLAVLPAYQGRGFGTSLIQYCNTLADTARLPTYLTAFPGAYSLYCKMDYEEVKHFDVDLNAWSKKKWTGFGIYRSYGMVREVGGLGRDASSRKMLSGKFTT